jgi:hypothetical protein
MQPTVGVFNPSPDSTGCARRPPVSSSKGAAGTGGKGVATKRDGAEPASLRGAAFSFGAVAVIAVLEASRVAAGTGVDSVAPDGAIAAPATADAELSTIGLVDGSGVASSWTGSLKSSAGSAGVAEVDTAPDAATGGVDSANVARGTANAIPATSARVGRAQRRACRLGCGGIEAASMWTRGKNPGTRGPVSIRTAAGVWQPVVACRSDLGGELGPPPRRPTDVHGSIPPSEARANSALEGAACKRTTVMK